MGVVLALPFTYGMGIIPALILLTAMYISGTYGGAFTSILFRIPGEPMDVPLLWDGYAMAQKGEPALALGWTLFSALAGGLVAATAMVALSGPVANLALRLSTPEYFAVILLGLSTVVTLGGSSLPKALISLAFGLLIATVGTNSTFGTMRFAFDIPILEDGIEYILVMVVPTASAKSFPASRRGAEAPASGRSRGSAPSFRTWGPLPPSKARLRAAPSSASSSA